MTDTPKITPEIASIDEQTPASSPKKEPKIYMVEDGEGTRLDRWLKRQIPELKQSVLEKLLRLGKIKLNGKRAKSGDHIAIDDVVSIYEDLTKYSTKAPGTTVSKEFARKSVPRFSKDELAWFESLIVWEDDDFLVINKPHGLAVQGGTKTTQHVDKFVTQYGLHRNCQYRLVHRIDKDTSGVLLLAKSSAMATYLGACFKEGNIDKTYWAVVVGHATPGYGTIDAPLIKAGFGDREKVIVDEKEGKKAITQYRTIKRLVGKGLDSLSWLELTPETGRTHQIRVHCDYMETPIVGDGKYGGMMSTSVDKTLHLHARSIAIKDRNGSKFVFTAPPPEHFVRTLRRYKIEWNQCI